jgi:hypothetical protein
LACAFHRLDECTEEEWDFVFDMNLTYVYRVLRPTLKVMVAQGDPASMIGREPT